MEIEPLSTQEKTLLLVEARTAIEKALNKKPLTQIKLEEYSSNLRENGASFVTLTENQQLRGCIGALEAYQPLILDVREHALAAAFEDYRFPPVQMEEISKIHIEISRLTPAVPLTYKKPGELVKKIKRGIDGVILKDGIRRATFLPQVWDQLPDSNEFLSHLCMKMGSARNTWQTKMLEVFIYQVEEFHE